MKIIDNETASEIHRRVGDWTNVMFSKSSQLAVKEFLANEKGMTFYESVVTKGE